MKRLLIIAGVLILLVGIALTVLARTLLTGENVRSAVASQVSAALGQPVTIGGLGASVYPRVTMDLSDVTIGEPARIEIKSMHLGTGLRGLISRRIENATVRVSGARITLPLPDLAPAGTSDPGSGAGLPVRIVSVDEIVFDDVEIVSGERTVRGEVELALEGDGVRIRRMDLAADGGEVAITGMLSSLAPIEGQLEATADALDFDALMAFLTDFTASAAPAAEAKSPAAGGESAASLYGRITVNLNVGRARTGGLELSDLKGQAVVTPAAATFEPLGFGIFDGRYEGTMRLALQGTPRFAWKAEVAGVDAAQLMAFAGSPDTVTGTLAGTVSLEGQGLHMEQALRTARGTATVRINDGTIAGLGLVRTIVVAGSGRGGIEESARRAADQPDTPDAEQFSRLGATWQIDRGVMATQDLAMSSTDVDLHAAGTVRFADMTAQFAGQVQLSEALSKQAGTDLYRYAQEGGRVTLPVTVTGPIQDLAVTVDVTGAARRAIRNRAIEETKKAIERNLPGLGGLFPK
ncbi:MAG TPA: AsmA family protein [Vicinamibacterales bacterium]